MAQIYTPPPSTRLKKDEAAKIAADVEAFLSKGGRIQECPTGATGDQSLGVYAMLMSDMMDAQEAKDKLSKMRKRGNRNGLRSRHN